jgi:predicted RNA-binding Zn-ribbon protein involved in translation (DUF1610 family)
MTTDFVLRWWLPAYIIFAVIMYVSAFAGWRIQGDARRRGLSKAAVTFWSVSAVFFGLIFVPLYLIFRARAVTVGSAPEPEPRSPLRLCPHCGQENPPDSNTCSKCRKNLDLVMTSLGQKQCPYCGRMNPVEASRCANCRQAIGLEDEDE